MKEEYVSYSQAVKLKELGFDWECLYFYPITSCLGIKRNCSHANFNSFEMSFNCDKYGEIFSAPRLDQAVAWIWDKYKLWIEVTIKAHNDLTLCIVDEYGGVKFIGDGKDSIPSTYVAGIDKALELLTAIIYKLTLSKF